MHAALNFGLNDMGRKVLTIYPPLSRALTQYYYLSVTHSVCNYQKVYADISAALIMARRQREGGFPAGAIIQKHSHCRLGQVRWAAVRI